MNHPLASHNVFPATPADSQDASAETAAKKFIACASATACSPSADKVFSQLWNVSGKED